MCGIFGIVANQDFDLGPILIEAGRRLAYRGYDSVGCATVSADGIDLRKDVGKIDEVSSRLRFAEMRGRRGIVQLRWATFGQPATRNAQLHLDCDGDMVGAHNGNIVNNVQLRETFIAEGHTVRGENDGETCVHAVERHLDRGGDMVEAIRLAYTDLAGDYAFVITHRDENRLYAIKKGSGLVIGLGEGVTCASSDLPSILPITRRILRVEDGEVAILWPEGAELRRVAPGGGARVEREPELYAGGMAAAEKGGYPHFMLKEIHEQPRLAGELLRLLADSASVAQFVRTVRRGDPLFFVGCGTSYHSEFKHGPLSAVRVGYPVAFITAPEDVEMMINHVNEVACREGLAIAIAEEDPRLRKNVQEYLVVPAAGQLLNPILATAPAQLVAYHMSVRRGIDPDFPRNLSKTLTVD